MVASFGKLCSRGLQQNLLVSLGLVGSLGRGRHLLNHSHNFYLVMFLVMWAVLNTMTYIQLPFLQGDQKVSVPLRITIQKSGA